MTNDRESLSQFILNEENSPLEILRMTLDFVEKNSDQASEVVIALRSTLRKLSK